MDDDDYKLSDKELIQQFNIILQRNYKWKEVIKFFKKETKEQARQEIYKLITNSVKADRRNATKGVKELNYKTTIGTTERRAFQTKTKFVNYPMTDDWKEDIIDKVKAMRRGVGGRVGFALKGMKIERVLTDYGVYVEEATPNITIKRLSYTTDKKKQIDELKNASVWNIASNRYYILQEIIMFYQLIGAKFYGDVEEDDNFKIYNPKSKTSCGHEILRMYNKDHKGKGAIPADEMINLLPEGIKLFIDEFPLDVSDGVLLKNGHYFRYVWKKEKKEEKKETIKRVKKQQQNLIFDLEADPNGRVVSIGATSNGEDYYEYTNENCIKEFVENLNCKYLIGYNSGKYDFILIRKELIKQGWLIVDYKRSCNSILRAEMTKGNRKIISVDLLNFTIGSLRNNLKTFKCQYAKGECDYSKICMPVSQDVLDYMRVDVMGTYELFLKLNEPFVNQGLDIRKLFTLSQGGEAILKQIWEDEKIPEPDYGKTSREKDNFYRQAIHGGRCERFKKKYKSADYGKEYKNVNKYMDALDCNSLYPSVMRNNNFPVGNSTYTEVEIDGKYGIYECWITPSDRNIPVLPPYTLGKRKQTLTSVDIRQGRKYGDVVEVICGYYWEKDAPIYKTYMDRFYEIKKNSAKGTPQYENAKLMMNAMYGKSCQRDKNVMNYTCRTLEDIARAMKLWKTQGAEYEEEQILIDCDDTYSEFYVEFSLPLPDRTKRKSYLGAFILSLSRELMTDYIQSTNPYYTDTDSVYVEECDFHRLPQSNNLGDFSSDLKGGGKIIQALFVGKKMKACEVIYPDGKIEWEYTGKGVRNDCLNSAMYEDMLEGKEIVIKNPSYFLRNVKNGSVNVVESFKTIKETDGGRVWSGESSKPRVI